MFLSRNSSRQFLWLSLLLWAAAFHVPPVLAQQDDAWDDDFKKAASPGQRSFNSTCAGCHGLDGRGGDKGVNIAGSVKVQHLSDAQVSEIISNGVPGTGMPSFHQLSARQVGALVTYVRILQGKGEARVLPGDPTRGKEIFFGKAECSTCHMISGDGGFLGPDLSAYGSARPAKAIRDEIVRPARIESAGYRSAVLSTRDDDHLEGVIRNEDNFSIQLQTKDGSFHFFQKSDLQSVQPLGQSLMPTNYGQKLTPEELKDLVSFLMNGATAAPVRTSHRTEDSTQ